MAPIPNMPRTPSLDALRIFVVAARHMSFTDAAEVRYEEVIRNGRIQKRRAPEVVTD